MPWCRVGSWGMGSYPPGYAQSEVVLRDHDLVWISAGAPTYRIDGTDVVAAAPCLLLLRPGMRMAIRWDRLLPSRNGYIHFTPRGVLAQVPESRRWPLHTPLPEGEVATPLLRHVLWLLSSRPTGWEALCGSALAHVVGMACSGALRADSAAELEPGPLGRKVAAALAARWSHAEMLVPPDLASLAAVARLSREGFCRAFRAEVGVAPLQALRLVRLERSARLLLDGAPVAQAALRCGFLDPFHFSRSFHAAFGCTPRTYRGAFAAGRVEMHLEGSAAFVAFRCCLASNMRWHE
ncbi:MAG: helix-turn-helix transcriptional regulator [Planctomycetes bacterium]|nr:helix-turn-helix transcriptional regulator [Planctomycetota bacterium]